MTVFRLNPCLSNVKLSKNFPILETGSPTASPIFRFKKKKPDGFESDMLKENLLKLRISQAIFYDNIN